MNLYDAHNHLQDDWLQPHLDPIAQDLAQVGLAAAVVNGTTPADWPQVSALARRFSWVVPSYGVHPWDSGNRPPDWREQLRTRLIAEPRAHVGEIGLDRWMIERAKPDDPRLAGLRRAPFAEQIEVFSGQLSLATELNRAASIHCLEAWGALADVLRGARRPAHGFLLHAYAGPAELVHPLADLGAYFSFNGAFLDPKRTGARAAFQVVPPDRLLVETDAPAMLLPRARSRFALPPACTGESLNHPANIAAVYAGLADLLAQPVPDLAARVETNFHHLFGSEKV
ncbi:MAG: TatD family hydrolase [Opitutales bacterium]